MPSQEQIDDQLKLLEITRRSLAHLVRQAARYGGQRAAATAAVAHGAAASLAGPEVAQGAAPNQHQAMHTPVYQGYPWQRCT